jgi:hypothetical protein
MNGEKRSFSMPGLLLRGEGLAVLGGALALYFAREASLPMLLVLFLAPDLSMVGYLRGPKLGAPLYNIVHTYSLPGVLIIAGVATSTALAIDIGLIWAAHIGMDRLVGFGLKYTTAFKDSHLQRV